ncbi:hypothetical protein DFP93_11310 [Aneurinibacillus soli]|uniref:Pyridoxamine 5'-phosphate oxidase n=1 Tax=Aneurinibacillus soli TaxID=1500254 RepID=A0A0U5B972_9BACL|nr:hypothetical protein DFP93_11310 [Aneurinibacillus soli]BAU27293.1 Pyridoxamine 5'-phosphate oxidase [Aneurinibacillus soli]
MKHPHSSTMPPMRRSQKDLQDTAQIDACLTTSRTGFLGLQDENGTYVVPLNFTWYNGHIYFHGSQGGRKYETLNTNTSTLCFTVVEDWGTITHPVPAHTGTAYRSVMVFGCPERVIDLTEATAAMQAMLDKYVPGYYNNALASAHVDGYRSSMGSPTLVYRLTPVHISGKLVPRSEEHMFYPGRTVESDV